MLLCGCFPRPGLGPAADLLFFASPKKRRQKKGDPAVCVPSLRYGQPAVLDVGGGPQNSLHCVALRQLRPLSLLRLRSSAQPEGSDTRHRFARLLEQPGRAFALLGQGFGPRVDFEPVFRLVVLGETLMRSRCARRLSAPGTAGYHQQAPLEKTAAISQFIPSIAGAQRPQCLGGRAQRWPAGLQSPLAAPRSAAFRGSGLALV
jgi:hypothetical protein